MSMKQLSNETAIPPCTFVLFALLLMLIGFSFKNGNLDALVCGGQNIIYKFDISYDLNKFFRYALQWESKNLIAVSTAIQDWLTSSN